ncbi:hypothetical protein K435DRAFT_648963 [Dendrothele bispora CBS 962.96]|uniref:Uncharacterized protein n=1 Tax=Dendrothele bispora (strain CBS 962.96) TaxID=1314807 RepID=A0A4V4HI01_DENBC|nr:hypothetical protein K435DRAFT_648963 [Dendrothele bispora CBS 962.96]
MSNQLYGDLQCMIKNAYFTVAKAKLLSPEYKMFICLLGDDVLEALFGRARMIGGHCPNCTIGELGRRFGSVLNCASILHRHPEWERKPDRLKMFRSQDFDHLRPRNWKGDVRVGPINLQACWDSGIINATDAVKKHGLSMEQSFKERFTQVGSDLMRPSGGKYIAISKEIDSSMENLSSNSMTADDDLVEIIAKGDSQAFENLLEFDAHKILEEEGKKLLPRLPPLQRSIFLEVDGKIHPKVSAIRIAFDNSGDISSGSSHDRRLRIMQGLRTYSTGHSNNALSRRDVANSSQIFQLGDLFATFITSEQNLLLVVVQSTSLKHSGSKTTYHNSVALDELCLDSSKYEVTGQVLSLLPFADSANQIRWAWNGSYAAFTTLKAKNTELKSAEKMTNLRIQSVPGYLIVPTCEHAKESPIEHISVFVESEKLDPSLTSTTWTFTNESLVELWYKAFQRLEKCSLSGKKGLVTVGKVLSSTIGFPYSTNLARKFPTGNKQPHTLMSDS